MQDTSDKVLCTLSKVPLFIDQSQQRLYHVLRK